MFNKKSTISYIVFCFILSAAVCISSMLYFSHSIGKKSEESIRSIGRLYMSSMSEQLSRHFNTTISLRWSQLYTLINNMENNKSAGRDIKMMLGSEGRLRGFDNLALIARNGEIQMIYGDKISIDNLQNYLSSLNEGNRKIALATTDDGDKLAMMGVSYETFMDNGSLSTALIAGISTEYIDSVLSLDENDDALTYSHIIRRDGSFVIKNSNVEQDNYFDRVRENFEPYNENTAEDYVELLKKAIENHDDYFTIFKMNDERRNLSITQLKDTEWYLITVMPSGELNQCIDDQNSLRSSIFLRSVIFIIIFFILLFLVYIIVNKKRIDELDKARHEALSATEAKSRFLSNISHYIRTPMNVIMGLTTIALSNTDDKGKIKYCLENIEQSGNHLLELVNNVLDMSQIENSDIQLIKMPSVPYSSSSIMQWHICSSSYISSLQATIAL